MLAETFTLLLAVAGQATAAFTIGHLAMHSYVETEATAGLKHDNSASQGKLRVVATRTLGDLTYTYLSAEFTAESATDSPGEAMPLTASSPTSIVTATATETHHVTLTTTITRTLMVNTTQPAAHTLPTRKTGDLPFHIHGGGDYTSITFYGGYGTPTTSNTQTTPTTEAPYAHSIDTTQLRSTSAAESTTAPTTASAPSTTSLVSSVYFSTVPTSTSSSSTTHSTPSSPLVSLASSSLSATSTETESATTLSGLTVPAETATATESPKAAETHGRSGGSRAKVAVNTLLLCMALVYLFVLC
ncbi:hypothetical protein F503_05825 [Ophiostoma piceae UAMH 11346]|uniref:Uncharacterized protein n=1 Tax=Ophiostoma piceae (strain UAMH 11346) TaxID=1262450 RepID=S3DB19_OPHP1|nr:hypothetical protein F503_05825 [Ophiostoma piceae UAMH 11346]